MRSKPLLTFVLFLNPRGLPRKLRRRNEHQAWRLSDDVVFIEDIPQTAGQDR
jgi:hypothetical protein